MIFEHTNEHIDISPVLIEALAVDEEGRSAVQTTPCATHHVLFDAVTMSALIEFARDAVGMGRPFYAEPRLPARVLAGEGVVCESCNNCIVPQVTGADGVCRTPNVLAKRGELVRKGAYEW